MFPCPGGINGDSAVDVTELAVALDLPRPDAADDGARTLALLETLVSKAPVGFGFVDRAYRTVMVNETMAAFNGSTVAEQVGRLIPDLAPSVWPRMEHRYRRVLDFGESV